MDDSDDDDMEDSSLLARNSKQKSDFVLQARLKQVARLWVTQLYQEQTAAQPPDDSSTTTTSAMFLDSSCTTTSRHDSGDTKIDQLLKIIQQDDDNKFGSSVNESFSSSSTTRGGSSLVALDEREGMIRTLSYWNDLINLRRQYNRQMILQNEESCTKNLQHWLSYCVLHQEKNGNTATAASSSTSSSIENNSSHQERTIAPSSVDVVNLSDLLLATPPHSPVTAGTLPRELPHQQPQATVCTNTAPIGRDKDDNTMPEMERVAISPGGDDTTTTYLTVPTFADNNKNNNNSNNMKMKDDALKIALEDKATNDPIRSDPEQAATVQNGDDTLRTAHNTLVALYHGKHCTSKRCQIFPHCAKAKALWHHVSYCEGSPDCYYEHCVQSQAVLTHFIGCQRPECRICGPVLVVIPRLRQDIEGAAATQKSPSRKRLSRNSSPSKRKRIRTTASTNKSPKMTTTATTTMDGTGEGNNNKNISRYAIL